MNIVDSDPHFNNYDRRKYVANHKPVFVNGSGVSLLPFFSPTYSTPTLVGLIEEAKAGDAVDIGTPGFDSWGNCTWASTGCQGCTIEQMKAETFPVFPAVLNAVHRGVKVRMLTNNYNTPTCPGLIAPLDFLSLNGVELKYYTTTTFMHAKYIALTPPADAAAAAEHGLPNDATTRVGSGSSRKASVSSINFSQTSFLKNREAGIVIQSQSQSAEGSVHTSPDSEALLDFLQSIFEFDHGQGDEYVVNNTYTKEQLQAITDDAPYPVPTPTPASIPGQYTPPAPAAIPLDGHGSVGITASPDYARQQLYADLNATKSSLQLMIYQVTDFGLCDSLQALSKQGINVTVLVSSDIYSHFDKQGAEWCYEALSKASILPRLTPSYYRFSHQKFWIVDGKKVGMSTGNWSPSDYNYPREEERVYPPYPSGDWQDTNRDFTVTVEDAGVVAVFDELFNGDWERGSDWYPGWCCEETEN